METKKVLAIDYGTQSVRVSIIDEKGKFLAFEQERYLKPYFSPKPGYCEQNPDFYYECMCKAAKRLSEKNPELLKECVSISSTCFRDTAVYLDKDFNVVRPSIIWLDQRQAELKKKTTLLQTVAFKIVGMTETVALNRKRTQAIWLQENEPENWAKIKYYLPLNVYLNFKMLGVMTDSASNMIGHYPIYFKKGKWYSKNAFKGSIFNIDLYKYFRRKIIIIWVIYFIFGPLLFITISFFSPLFGGVITFNQILTSWSALFSSPTGVMEFGNTIVTPYFNSNTWWITLLVHCGVSMFNISVVLSALILNVVNDNVLKIYFAEDNFKMKISRFVRQKKGA